MIPQPVSLTGFLADAAGHGSAVGLATTAHDPTLRLPAGFRSVRIEGPRLTTRDDLFSTFAQEWDFPGYFGHNADAFDDCMRDLDRPAGTTGLLTVITDAQDVLTSSARAFTWFAESMVFYRDHYRDVADPPAAFALLLITSPAARRATAARWADAGVAVAAVDLRA
ncbi:barstar family protein [Gordonia sp. DT30]|uniref:barstar family protein n=1 Tax=unclassified Gordonia (in: high G+C Gram-positive bacteria) TaxID=2657482 RepID=UPI003CFA2103